MSTFVYDNANVSYSVTCYNMQSVTSNAVSKAMSYSTNEYFTGKYWVDGKKIYGRVFASENGNYSTKKSRYQAVMRIIPLLIQTGMYIELIQKGFIRMMKN